MTTATLQQSRTTPTAARALWLAIPYPVRQLLRCRVPLDCREVGNVESLIVSVGSGCPLRWLRIRANDEGELEVRLWEVRRRNHELAHATTTADGLVMVLQRWAREYGLSSG